MFRGTGGKRYAQTDAAYPKSTSYCPNETGHTWMYKDSQKSGSMVDAGIGLEVQCTGMVMFISKDDLLG